MATQETEPAQPIELLPIEALPEPEILDAGMGSELFPTTCDEDYESVLGDYRRDNKFEEDDAFYVVTKGLEAYRQDFLYRHAPNSTENNQQRKIITSSAALQILIIGRMQSSFENLGLQGWDKSEALAILRVHVRKKFEERESLHEQAINNAMDAVIDTGLGLSDQASDTDQLMDQRTRELRKSKLRKERLEFEYRSAQAILQLI